MSFGSAEPRVASSASGLFQGVRSFLFVIAFVLACLAVTSTG
ncbi:hypothetical protein [Saccharopolyspora halophila]